MLVRGSKVFPLILAGRHFPPQRFFLFVVFLILFLAGRINPPLKPCSSVGEGGKMTWDCWRMDRGCPGREGGREGVCGGGGGGGGCWKKGKK